MKKLNILELHRTIKAKQGLIREVYDIILNKCHRRIELTTENQKLKCFFEVPSFVLGYPLYDLNKCVEYIINALKNNGFVIEYYFPNYIYISWDIEEEQKRDQIKKPINKDNYLMAPLSNTFNTKSLLTSSIQKTNGKISLNL